MKKETRSPRSPVRRSTKRPAAKSSRTSKPKHTPTPGLYGWITHTELATNDPAATKAWCTEVLGWTMTQSMPMPGGGEYQLFAYSDTGGGGIRKTAPGETPHSSFTVHVADCRTAFDKAIRAGAEAVQQPTRIMEGVTIAVVREPGGVRVGFSGP